MAFALERFDTSIKNVGDVNRYAQLPTLGVIPSIATVQARELASKSSRRSNRGTISITDGGTNRLPRAQTGSNGSNLESERAFTQLSDNARLIVGV